MTFKKEKHTVRDIHEALSRIPNSGLQIDVEALKRNAPLWREYARLDLNANNITSINEVQFPNIRVSFRDEAVRPQARTNGVPEPFMPKRKKQ